MLKSFCHPNKKSHDHSTIIRARACELMESVPRCGLCGLVGAANGARRAVLVPVVGRNIVVGADVLAAEAKVVVAQRPVRVVEVSVVGHDAVVVSSMAVGVVSQVVAETAERRIVLLEDNGLCFNFADLLGDDLLRHLLKDSQALLNDSDLLSVANKFAVLLDHNLVEIVEVGKVVSAIEVIESVQGRYPAPVIEGLASSSKGIAGLVGRSGHPASSECNGNEESGEFGEHNDCVLERMCSDCVKNVRPTRRIQTKS